MPSDTKTTRDAHRPPIVRELHIDAPIDDVWRALTEGEEIRRWFAPRAESTPGPGGMIRLAWSDDVVWDMPIGEWEPPRRLVVADGGSGAGADAAQRIEYTLESATGGTDLRLVHSGFAPGAEWDEIYDGTSTGWTFELRALKHYLEHHHGRLRRLVRAAAPVSIPAGEAWRRLFAPDALGLVGADPDSLGEGDAFEADAATGERFTGRVVMRAPTCLGVVIDQFNGAMLRVLIERWCGDANRMEAMVWLSAYDVDRHTMEDFERRWTDVLTRLFAP